MQLNHIGAAALLALLGTVGGLDRPHYAGAQTAPHTTQVIATWESPQLLFRASPRGPALVSLPSIAPDGHVLMFNTHGEEGDELMSYYFDPKAGVMGDAQVVPTDQWKVRGDPRRLYLNAGWGDPVPVMSRDGKKIVESLTTDDIESGDGQAPAYIFDRDPATGKIQYESDPGTGRLSEKHRLVTREDLRQLHLPATTSPVWRNASFSPDSRFVYVPVRIMNNLRYPYTMILQKELNAKTGAYENPRLILPPGGWDIRSGVGVSNDGTYYLASGLSNNPNDGLFILPNLRTRTPVRLRSFKDDEVIYCVPRNPYTGDAAGPARVVRALRALRATRFYEHLPAGIYPWFCRAPVAYPNSNVWLFEVELGREQGGEVQLLAATEAFFGIEPAPKL